MLMWGELLYARLDSLTHGFLAAFLPAAHVLHDRDRDSRDRGPPGSDPCHLYVGYIAAHVTDQMLEGLFRRCV